MGARGSPCRGRWRGTRLLHPWPIRGAAQHLPGSVLRLQAEELTKKCGVEGTPSPQGAWARSWRGELSLSPASHRGLGAAAPAEAEAGLVPCREALGSPGQGSASAHKGFLGRRSAVGYTTLSRASVGLQAAGLGAAFPAGEQNQNQMFPLRRAARGCHAASRSSPGAKTRPRGTRQGSAHGDGAGSGAAGGTVMVEPAPSSAPRLAPPFFWDGALGASRALGRCRGTPGWGEGGANGQHCGGDRTAWAREIRLGTTKKSLQSLIPLEGGWEADMQSPAAPAAADPARLAGPCAEGLEMQIQR